MVLCRSRYHMLQLAEELATATNRQLTLAEHNNVLNYKDYLSEWMAMWCVFYVYGFKLIMLITLVFDMQCMHIGGIM